MNIGGPISGTSGPQSVTYSAPDPVSGFGSIVVYNSSGSNLDVYVGQAGVAGSPSFTVAPNVVVTYPIAGAPCVTVAFEVFPTTGNASVNLTDAVLSAASSVLPGSVGGAGVFPAASQMQVTTVFGSLENGSSGGIIATALTGQSIYVYSYSLVAINTVANNLSGIYLKNPSALPQNITAYQWMLYSGATPAPIAIAASGGPVPLLVCPETPELFWGIIVNGQQPSIDFSLDLTYAAF